MATDNRGTCSQIAEGRKYIGMQIGRAWLETSDVTNRASTFSEQHMFEDNF